MTLENLGIQVLRSHLETVFPRWRIERCESTERTAGVGTVFHLHDDRGVWRHIFGVKENLLEGDLTEQQLGEFLASHCIKETLTQRGKHPAWLGLDGWEDDD